MNALFICSRNRLRSPTAEAIFADCPGWKVASASTSPDAEEVVTPEWIALADVIFVMERSNERKVTAKFACFLAGKGIVCLRIPDDYPYTDPALVASLNEHVLPHLRKSATER